MLVNAAVGVRVITPVLAAPAGAIVNATAVLFCSKATTSDQSAVVLNCFCTVSLKVRVIFEDNDVGVVKAATTVGASKSELVNVQSVLLIGTMKAPAPANELPAKSLI